MDPTNATMNNSRVIFTCGSCSEALAVDRDHSGHNISIGSFGVTVSPGWCCPECGLEGKIKNGKVIVTGRKRIPPSGAMNAYRNPKDRPAVKINSSEFAAMASLKQEVVDDPDDCPERRKHGYYARVKEECPICGGQWHETETLTDEDVRELREQYEEERNDRADDGDGEEQDEVEIEDEDEDVEEGGDEDDDGE